MKQSADKPVQTHLETDDHSSPTVLEITFVSILVAIVKISFIYFFNIFWKYQKALAIFLSEFIPTHDRPMAAVLEITWTMTMSPSSAFLSPILKLISFSYFSYI